MDTTHKNWELVQGDALRALRNIEDKAVDAVVTDPPYEIGYGGNGWDRTGIAFSVELWKEAFRVLKPGGHLLAFTAGRTYHRVACAIEDAGFELRDQLIWLNGQGPLGGKHARAEVERAGADGTAWEGYRTDLKTGQQPIVLARRPLDGTLAENLVRWGTGALNIEGCRLPHTPEDENGRPQGPERPGRYPSNVLLSAAGAEELDQEGPYSKTTRIETVSRSLGGNVRGSMQCNRGPRGYTDSGGPSRFFFVAKASTAERRFGLGPRTEPHPTTKPLALMRQLIRLVAPPADAMGTKPLIIDPFAGSAVTGGAALMEGCRFLGVELRATQARHAKRRLDAWEAEAGVAVEPEEPVLELAA